MDFKAILGMGLVLVLLPLLILWLIGRIFRHKASKKGRDEYSRRFEERVLKPNF